MNGNEEKKWAVVLVLALALGWLGWAVFNPKEPKEPKKRNGPAMLQIATNADGTTELGISGPEKEAPVGH